MENHIEVEETKQDKGFTLVELLIVIVILGILATVTVFAVTGITDKGKTSACDADAKTIQTAEEAYSANTGSYTENQSDLVAAGLLHDESVKVTVDVTLGVAAGPGADTIMGTADDTPATLDSYTVAGVAGGDCDGMTFEN
jgi:general secretion pathway protein G